jgi:hypothetical protein
LLSQVLLALNAEVIVGGGHITIYIDSEMKVLVNQEVVSAALADNSKIIYKRLIELAIFERAPKVILGHSNRMISVAGNLANAGDALRLEMSLAAKIVAIHGNGGQKPPR